MAGDVGASLACTVAATNGSGSGAATSAPVTATGGGSSSMPANTSPPTATGSALVGTALTCDKGTWTGGNLSYQYSWSRDGVPVADSGSDKYVVLSAPSISGVLAVGQTLTCSVGTWTGSPTGYTTVWQRGGATVGTGLTYVMSAADEDQALRCLVVATNAAGKGAAETTSAQVELTIRPPSGATTIAVSNNASMSGASVFSVASGACTYPWTLDSIPGLPLEWSVYVQFDTDAATYSDAILVRESAGRGVVPQLIPW